ncbi:uncharacterized protein [Salvelinus sp. IW2-2015]|uniref:uncharacterized protein isoform X2 n=1 Tax=Salvelinus sp. IW2-2015 TaxID=2691554 RepID=UPI0038D46D02
MAMPMYIRGCSENVKSGKVLLGLSDEDLELGLGVTSSMPRRKLRLAIKDYRDAENGRGLSKAADMDHHWVAKAWLIDVGLPQYSQAFHTHLVDGCMLNSLTQRDLERSLDVTKKAHQVSLLLGIELLHTLNFDKESLTEHQEGLHFGENAQYRHKWGAPEPPCSQKPQQQSWKLGFPVCLVCPGGGTGGPGHRHDCVECGALRHGREQQRWHRRRQPQTRQQGQGFVGGLCAGRGWGGHAHAVPVPGDEEQAAGAASASRGPDSGGRQRSCQRGGRRDVPVCIKNGPPSKGHPANLTQLWEALESTWASIPVESF